jgi:hypothetical protein
MKHVFSTAAALLVLASLAVAGDVSIQGPDKIEAGSRPTKYTIAGAALPDLIQGQAKLIWYPREGVEVWDAASWSGEPYLLLVADRPTKVLLAISYAAGGKLVYAEHEVTVGGDTPPNPPQPPDPPVPGGKKQLVFVVKQSELDNLPQAQQILLASLTLREKLASKGHRFLGILEANQAASAPQALAPFYRSVDGDPLPRIAMAPVEGGTITDYPLPADEAGLLKLLEGGK